MAIASTLEEKTSLSGEEVIPLSEKKYIVPRSVSTEVTARSLGMKPGQTITTKLQTAIDNLGPDHQITFDDADYYLDGECVIAHNAFYLKGLSPYATTFIMQPSASQTGLKWTKSGTPQYYGGLSNALITSTDTTYTKQALHFEDLSEIDCSRLIIQGMYGNNSSCIEFAGRENSTFEKIQLQGDTPFIVGVNPNTENGWLSGDHIVLRDMQYKPSSAPTGTNPSASIFIRDGAMFSGLTLTGRQAMVGGQYGLYHVDTLATGISYDLTISNLRREQAVDATKYDIYIDRQAQPLKSVKIQRFYSSVVQNGVYARGIATLEVDQMIKSANEIFNISNVDDFIYTQVEASTSCTATYANMKQVSASPKQSAIAFPRNAHYIRSANVYQEFPAVFMGVKKWSHTTSLNDDATLQIPINADAQGVVVAHVTISATNGSTVFESASFVCAPATGGTNGIKKIGGTTNTAAGNVDGSLCLYCSAGSPLNAPVYVYNRLGVTATIVVDATYK